MTKLALCQALLFAALPSCSVLFAQPSLVLSSGTLVGAGPVSLNLTLTSPPGNEPAGIQWTFNYSPSSVVSFNVIAASALTAANKTISCAGDADAYICLATGLNFDTIANGVVATVHITLSGSVTLTTIGLTNTLGATLDGQGIPISPTGGTVGISPQLPPSPVSSSPAAGSGGAAFAFSFNDPGGWQDLGVVNILFNDAIDGHHACYLAYSQPSKVIYLIDDPGLNLLPGLPSTAAGTLSNSQCTVSWGAAAESGSGNTLTLSLAIQFNPGFAGNKVIYLAAGNIAGNNSGWQPMGVWQVPGGNLPIATGVVGMTPARSNTAAQATFTFGFSDTRGFQDIGVANILLNNVLDGRRACYLAYARSVNVLYLVNDTGDALLPGQSLNSSGSVGNGQCMVSWASAPVNTGGDSLTLTLNIALVSEFGGNRVFYLAARDAAEANNTGWQSMGTWTTP